MKLLRLLVTLVVTLSFAAVLDTPATAYTPSGLCNGTPSPRVQYMFKDSPSWHSVPSGWTQTPAEAAAAGFAMWQQGRNRDGTAIADMKPYPYAGYRVVTVLFSAAPGTESDNNGYAYCSGDRIELNTGMLNTKSQRYFSRVAAHEMGHLLGAHHTGSGDSAENGDGTPLMATCLSDWEREGSEYTTDDEAMLTSNHAIGTKTLTANYGFERGLQSWHSSGADTGWVTGSTSGGSHHMRVLPSSSSENIHQVVNLANASGMEIRPSLQYTTPGATTGSIRIQMLYKVIPYTPTSDENSGCSAIDYVDMNDRWDAGISGAWTLARDEYLPLSNSWRVGMEATPWTVPSVSGGSVDVLLRVFSSAAVSTGYVNVHYDDVRIQVG